jgi:hypothetical protein
MSGINPHPTLSALHPVSIPGEASQIAREERTPGGRRAIVFHLSPYTKGSGLR